MRIAVHQPEFLPWLGFFDKMGRVDHYVVFDHVQFKKRYFENRNRIRRGKEAVWISVPVKSKGRFEQPINAVEIDNSTAWRERIWDTVRHAYARAPHFKNFAEEIQRLITGRPYERLMDFNLAWITWFRNHLKIETPMILSSELGVEAHKGSDLILAICRRLKADRYLCGPSGKDYLRLENFTAAGVVVEWQNFHHPVYPQLGEGFEPYLSCLDLILNCGPRSRDILFPPRQGEAHS